MRIPLTRGKFAIIDSADLPLVENYKWCAWWSGHNWYARSGRLYLHRLIQGGREIDHKNGNGLDCRRDNLRPATHSQNLANRGKNQNNTSGMKGVIWCKYTRRWRAKIQVLGRHIHLGRFDTVTEAGEAYRHASKHHFGVFSKT